MNRRIIKISLSIITLTFIFASILGNDVSAKHLAREGAVWKIADKAVFQGVYNCYGQGYIKETVSLDDYEGKDDPMEYLFTDDDSDGHYVPLVTDFDQEDFGYRNYKVYSDGLSCQELFDGYGCYGFLCQQGSSPSLLKAFGKQAPDKNDNNGVTALTKNMGYDISTDSPDKCYSINYTEKYDDETSEGTTNQICQEPGGDIYVGEYDENGHKPRFYIQEKGFNGNQSYLALGVRGINNIQPYKLIDMEDIDGVELSGEWLLGQIKNACGNMTCEPNFCYKNSASVDCSTTFSDNIINEDKTSTKKEKGTFLNDNDKLAALTAINYLSDGSIVSQEDIAAANQINSGAADLIKVTDLQKRILYQAYLTDLYYGADIVCDTAGKSAAAYDDTIQWLDDDNKIKECFLDKSDPKKDGKVNGVNDEGFFEFESLDIDDLIEEIKKLPTEYPGEDIESLEVNDGSNDDPNDVTPTCQNQGGAGALGWIVCSILDWMEHAAEQLYTDIVVPQLRVEPALFQNGSSSSSSSSTLQPAAEAAWSTFRDIANIIFTIIVLFVIFSQLTGVGIDNYGIKKILPKLIVAAVLINLSYLICLICVDLSNIVGNGLQAFFNSFQILGEDRGGNYGGQGIGNDIGFVAVSIIAVIVTGVAVYKNPALLLVFFISVIGVLISLIFILILLVGRKAVIVLLTVVSPVAFILYMLPNTKKIFDKWFNLWKAMLLVYPICGLLIGGGNFASKLMLVTVGSSGDTASLFAALIVGIIPIFFIPTVIKSAYAAIGHIGGAIAGFGGRFRGGFDRRVRGSQAFQRARKSSQDRNQRISAMRRAGVKLDKDGNVVESKRPTARLKRSLSGTAAGRRLGLQASMGQSFNEFAAMEATRRGRIAGSGTDAMNAVFAGVADKESAQRVSDHETLMKAGKVQIDGRNLNVNNAGDMQKYHKAMLETAHQKRAAGDTAGYNAAMDKVKAAQNIMAKSDVGRGNIQANYDAAIRSNNTEGLEDAAGHLLGVHGSDIKASNRAMHKLAQDLAKGINASKVKTKIDNNSYNIDSIGGYNAQTLAAADEKALKDLYDNMDAINNATNDRGEHEARDQLARLVNEALDSPNIQPQEKVRKQLEDIRRGLQTDNGGTPTSNPNENRAPGERRTPGGIIY